MIEAKDTWCIQIETTNKCEHKCSNCTHFVGHGKSWEMELDFFSRALKSLKNWDKVIGLIGGNPLLHTKFTEMTYKFKAIFTNKDQRGLWTSSFFDKEKFCRGKYGYINYNPHDELVMHQPVLCSIKDIISDKKEREKYISDCWLAEKWSPSITPKGVYRCEVAGCMDMYLNYNLGLPLELDWWKRPLSDFQKQIDTFCHLCSICVPLTERKDKDGLDDMTPTAYNLFKDSKRINKAVLHKPEDLKVKTKDGWKPYNYIVRMRDEEHNGKC